MQGIQNGQKDIKGIFGLKMIDRKLLLEKLLHLRSRIENWGHQHGWKNIDNYKERKNRDGKIVWKLSDWEFVDSMYGAVYNGKSGFGNDYSFNKDTVKTWNRLWKRYEIDVPHDNPNLKAEWEQIQQMEWDDDAPLGTYELVDNKVK